MTANNTNEDEFYDEATDEFPGKEDFRNRLVAIWLTGKKGVREGENGKDYPWVETYTLALDDGPDGAELPANKMVDGEEKPWIIGAAPAMAENMQWSASGVYSRIAPKLNKHNEDGSLDCRPIIGRINSRPNAKKGLAPSWSLGAPTEADRATARKHKDLIQATSAKVKSEREAAADAEAFTS